MGIGKYIKDVGRGKDGARALSREAAQDLLGQVLDGAVSDLEIGAFCLAMRIKGETPTEMAGFLDALQPRLQRVPASTATTIVLPCYNGARKLPVLTPLLALLLAREGLPVFLHGWSSEATRVSSAEVLALLGVPAATTLGALAPGQIAYVPTPLLSAPLQRLLDVRRLVGVRNSAHSLVKLMNPCAGPSLLVTSYTHPEYATSMAATLALVGARALLLRGTEGEPVADARRTPRMQWCKQGELHELQAQQPGSLEHLPTLPGTDPAATAGYIRQVLAGTLAVPAPIALQVQHIVRCARQP